MYSKRTPQKGQTLDAVYAGSFKPDICVIHQCHEMLKTHIHPRCASLQLSRGVLTELLASKAALLAGYLLHSMVRISATMRVSHSFTAPSASLDAIMVPIRL